ncbi:hypothetical protein [Nocardioides sp. B-3]|uniref:hypothetical protein n=1 Tax=Nocardioides sp. B-3 TaxID=2895565 RepID=UPI0021533390|nr:hypothetical protein [Nocardioides sp. B-3]UUZ60280.1 hypothetical protein LP418_04945 [Nocardioides sp. B-3]
MPDSTSRRPGPDLSLPQLVAGAVAAATATILSSRLDLMGTVLGAVPASIVSAIVTASVAGWWHRMREAREWVPQRIKGTLVGLGALGLLVLAFHTGVDTGHRRPAARHLRRALARRGRAQSKLNQTKATSAATITRSASRRAMVGARFAIFSSAR